MSEPDLLGIDAVRTGGALTALSGLSSLVRPAFEGLAVALLALTALAWTIRLDRSARSIPRGSTLRSLALPLATAVAALVVLAAAPVSGGLLDGPALGAAGAALALSDPARRASRSGR
jgi:hypothetical protein